MTPPPIDPVSSSSAVFLRIVLAVLCLLPLTAGLLVIVVISAIFIAEGFLFAGDEAMWMAAFLAMASAIALPPAIVLGIVLRYARWRQAPTASLVLAIIITAGGVMAAGVARTMIAAGDMESYVTLLMFSIAGLVLERFSF